MSKITVKCDFCGAGITRYKSQIKGKNFCCKDHLNKFNSKEYNPSGYRYRDFSKNSERFTKMNPEWNKFKMDFSTKSKLQIAMRGKGENKTYPKMFGRHVHRVVMERKIGRKLKRGEVVHHIDGDKNNNSPENLMLFKNQAEHALWHMKEGDTL